nr:MAG TPA: hypothetical protein [Caudoviricetes sp.]DAS31953.1 MAG TPA: hypothetical protein [Caudoviricetes sp.]
MQIFVRYSKKSPKTFYLIYRLECSQRQNIQI